MMLSDAERDELRAVVRDLLSGVVSGEGAGAGIDGGAGFDAALWSQMVELGWTSIHVDEAAGGAGGGYAELAVVLAELGRALVAAPFLSSAVLATGALSLADDERVAAAPLASLVSGEAIGAVALAGTSGSYDLERCTATLHETEGEVRLGGAAGFVLDADVADVLVVAARDESSTTTVVLVDGNDARVRAERVPTVDRTRRAFEVTFDDVPTLGSLCAPGGPSERLHESVLALGVIATAADAAGAAGQSLEVAVEYAKERMQFGKPIGSFQAVKHHCANMAIAVEASRAAVRAAVGTLDGDPTEWGRAAAMTSSFVGPACSEVCALELRVHGGIGFTWEHDTHRRLERTKLDEVLFGTPSWHRRRLAATTFPAIVDAS